MKVSTRSFSDGEDKRQMFALSRQFPAENLRATDLVYRKDYAE